MPSRNKGHQAKGSANNQTPKPDRQAAAGSQQQQIQQKTNSQQQNVNVPASTSTTNINPNLKKENYRRTNASWILHDVFKVSGPLELGYIASAYITVFAALTLFTLKFILGPLIGDQVDLPFVTMEPGNIGVVKEFDVNVVRVMWCMSGFTSFNAVLGLMIEETEGLEHFVRYPVVVFLFFFGGFIDTFRIGEWSPAQATEYKHMREQARAENWECLKKALRVGLVWQITIVFRFMRMLWQELRWNYNLGFFNFSRRREQKGAGSPATDCAVDKKPQNEHKGGKKTGGCVSRVIEGPKLRRKQDVIKVLRQRDGVAV